MFVLHVMGWLAALVGLTAGLCWLFPSLRRGFETSPRDIPGESNSL